MINKTSKPEHYYGDTVRFLFLIAAVIMLISLPSFSSIINIPIVLSVGIILVLGLVAGLTNPRQKWEAIINVGVASVGFLISETQAVLVYQQNITTTLAQRFFITNLGLGLIFLIALYFAVKTLRGLILTDENQKNS